MDKSQKKVLIAEDTESIREYIELMLEDHYEEDLLMFEDGEQLIKYLESNGNEAKLIVSDYDMPTATGGDVYQYLKDSGSKIPFILLSSYHASELKQFKSFFNDHPMNKSLQKPDQIGDLPDVMTQILADDLAPEEKTPDVFKRINLKHLFNFNECPVDIYIRLSDDKFVKLIKKNELYSHKQLHKYSDKGVNQFYIQYVDFEIYHDFYYSYMMTALVKSGEKVHVQLSALDYVSETLNDYGISDSFLEMANQAVTTAIVSLSYSKKIGAVLKELLEEDDSSYLAKHSMLIAHLAPIICKEMGIDSEQTISKLVAAALLHDTTLSDDLLTSFDQISATKLMERKNELLTEHYLKHPLDIGMLFKDTHFQGQNISDIVLQHHENPDGTGFPLGIGHDNISPLSAIFIVCEKMAHFVLKEGSDKEKLEEFIQNMKTYYSYEKFLKPINALTNVIDDLNKE